MDHLRIEAIAASEHERENLASDIDETLEELEDNGRVGDATEVEAEILIDRGTR